MSDVTYFLVVYDSDSRSLVEMPEYNAAEVEAALEAYFQKEQEYKDRPYIEVVLLGSRSLEDVKVTHARYFGEIPDDGGLEQIRSMGQSLQFA